MRKQIDDFGKLRDGSKLQHRRGFTVVELLVVIAIMGILAALISTAVYGAIVSARQATIKLEVTQLAMALESYKTEIGEYPPDFSELTENEKREAINSHLGRRYRLRRPGLIEFANDGRAIGGDELTDEDLAALNPTNALYFWLRGFSQDPQRPLTGAGDRDPYYDFDMSRIKAPLSPPPINLIDPTKPVIAGFVPNGDPQERPYLYYRATPRVPITPNGEPKLAYYDAAVWAIEANKPNGNVDADHLPAGVPQFPTPYLSGVLTRKNSNGTTRPEFVEPEKYQLICAGLDGFYGIGAGDFSGAVGIYPDGPYLKNDRDNITSFSESSTLEDSTP